MTPKTIIKFEAHDDFFVPWDFALDSENVVIGKSPYEGQKVIGFAPSGNMDIMEFTGLEGWQEKVTGLVPVLADKGKWYQLTSHVVRDVRPFEGS
jgi:hypothetical protein